MNCEVVLPRGSIPGYECCSVCGRASPIAEADGPTVNVHALLRFEPHPESVIEVEHFGLRISREDQELHRRCLEARRETTDCKVVAVDCVDGVALEYSTPPRSEKLGVGQAGHLFTSSPHGEVAR